MFDLSRRILSDAYLCDEDYQLSYLISLLQQTPELERSIQQLAERLVTGVRQTEKLQGGWRALLQEYDLSSHEGIALMCLAEALLRIPDEATADKLIQDKLSHADWYKHLGHSDALLVNASTWGLLLTGKLMDWSAHNSVRQQLFNRYAEPYLRRMLKQAMALLGEQFVMGRDMQEAWARSKQSEHLSYRFSFDMLGEAALTRADASAYAQAYQQAIAALRAHAGADLFANAGISVKLSALYPRYDYGKYDAAVAAIVPVVLQLARAAKQAHINLTLDAEEAERLELSLEIFTQVYQSAELSGWHGLGLAVQAYQKRALPVLHYLAELAKQVGRIIPVRLVKGAYWDSEIKWAQERGLSSYPVFTRKAATDVSYLACAQFLLANPALFYPQFATHNARTVAHIVALKPAQPYEFQRLHGMGEALYQQLRLHYPNIPCRVYAPVGSHQQLLPYLVRRLLENGANSSFVNQIIHPDVPVSSLIRNPLDSLADSKVCLPADLYQPERRNSAGLNLADSYTRQRLLAELKVRPHFIEAQELAIYNPANLQDLLGYVSTANRADVSRALDVADYQSWAKNTQRADILDKVADLLEQQRSNLMSLIIREAGRTIVDALNEVREAVDFCRYYAAQARLLTEPCVLRGITGETSTLSYAPRGVFVCISPWNFPVAIFTGQVAAALVTGNAVIAKPAEATPLCASLVVRLFHQAGVPQTALQLLIGTGSVVGKQLVEHRSIAGVAFTGSTRVAQQINQSLAQYAHIRPLIAETGGQNCMIVDSSALPEQVVKDVINSAFNSAGQRCSALRVLFLQQEIASTIINMLSGAMDELIIGDPSLFTTDIGPVISQAALQALQQHQARMDSEAMLLKSLATPNLNGYYYAPRVYQIDNLRQLPNEVFGPILHVIIYQENQLDQVIADINATHYGLTLGIHSRINRNIQHLCQNVFCGNVYVNRNMIGAVVGSQPFGGEGLSGTGPKAGGPNYLKRFMTERVQTVNTAAVGGNVGLFGGDNKAV